MQGPVEVSEGGLANAIRIITKNLLAIEPRSRQTAEWIMGYLIVPLASPLLVHAGDQPIVSFDYEPGDELHVLTSSLTVRPAESGFHAVRV